MTGPQIDPALVADELDPTGQLAADLEAQRVEYETYVAKVKIHASAGVLAYDVGHQVPVSNVVKHGYWDNGQVELVKGAQHPPEIAATLTPEPAPAAAPDPAPGLSVDRTGPGGAPPIDEEEER